MRSRGLIACLALIGLVAGACGGGDDKDSNGGGSSDTTLRLAFSSDMDPPDPDTSYQLAGNQLMTAVYEGLLEYAPDNSTKIVGRLAESWTVSDDGLTYTFTLRDGLKFADGSTLDSTAMKAGFERRTNPAVQSPSSYMLLPVAGYETPDPRTFTIKLSYPESAFLTYLASPFSPKALNPKLLEEHDANGDAAVEWMKTNSAGSGPYVISEFVLGQRYVLTRNDNYWGKKPFFERVEIRIIPDAATQVLQLEGGDLDIISSQPVATVKTFEGRDGFQVVTFPVFQKAWIHVNPSAAPTDDQAFREALRAAIDRPKLVDQIWGKYAKESTQLYPAGSLAAGLGADTWTYDPSKLEALASGKTVRLAYPADRPADQQVAEALQAQFGAAGLTVELVPTPDADIGSWMNDPASAPNLYFEISFPDSTHPDTWSRLFWYNDVASGFGGFLNYFIAGSAASDEAMNTGLAAVDQATVDSSYDASAKEITGAATYITIADNQDVFIARAGITGFSHWLPTPLTLRLDELSRG